ncbi:MAG: hypothetical protein ACHQ4H_01075 [Ktedonobacterales bacterium]
MQDFIENAKRAANTAIERAAFEADKLRRGASRQREVELAQRERTTLLEQIASLLLELQARGEAVPQTLRQLAEHLRQLDGEIASGRADTESIRNEPYKPGSVQIQVTRNDVNASAPPTPVARVTPVPVAPVATVPCVTCDQPVRVGAAFCASCGARMR